MAYLSFRCIRINSKSEIYTANTQYLSKPKRIDSGENVQELFYPTFLLECLISPIYLDPLISILGYSLTARKR